MVVCVHAPARYKKRAGIKLALPIFNHLEWFNRPARDQLNRLD
jgi:hypothetical protein